MREGATGAFDYLSQLKCMMTWMAIVKPHRDWCPKRPVAHGAGFSVSMSLGLRSKMQQGLS